MLVSENRLVSLCKLCFHHCSGEAFKKVLQIHSRLPEGGILIFLTGQQEIQHLCRQLQDYDKKQKRKLARQKSAAPAGGPPTPDDAGEVQDTNAAASNELSSDSDLSDAQPAGNESSGSDSSDDDSHSVDSEGSRDSKTSQRSGTDAKSKSEQQPYQPLHVLPLFAMMPRKQQVAVFQSPPKNHRLIVVATNVAETSVTIPNIRYVNSLRVAVSFLT